KKIHDLISNKIGFTDYYLLQREIGSKWTRSRTVWRFLRADLFYGSISIVFLLLGFRNRKILGSV
ncbi:hypothetical protein LEP1GSC161_3016, partial [Leptospira santarosai str. CBC1416]